MPAIELGGASGAGLDLLSAGEATLPRLLATSGVGLASGDLKFTYFTAAKSELTTQVRTISHTTAAGATPTMIRIGLYLAAANGDLSLVAATANDTTLFAATNTAYTRSWQSPYQKVAGRTYALGIVFVTAAATPLIVGNPGPQSMYGTGEYAVGPRLVGRLGGQTDLPASVASASINSSQQPFYGVILP